MGVSPGASDKRGQGFNYTWSGGQLLAVNERGETRPLFESTSNEAPRTVRLSLPTTEPTVTESRTTDWRDLVERVVRNLLQTLTPLLASTPLDWWGVGRAALTVVVWTVAKWATGWVTPPDAPWWRQLVERIGSAVAASLLVTIPASWTGDPYALEWSTIAANAAAAALLALLMLYATPPTGGLSTGGVHRRPGPRHRASARRPVADS